LLQLEGPSNGAQRHRRPAHEVHSAEDLKSKKNAACTLNNQVIAWLRDQASNQPGHDTFMESRGKTLQNPKIVQAWRFATTFVDQYAWKSFEIPVCIITCWFLTVANKQPIKNRDLKVLHRGPG